MNSFLSVIREAVKEAAIGLDLVNMDQVQYNICHPYCLIILFSKSSTTIVKNPTGARKIT